MTNSHRRGMGVGIGLLAILVLGSVAAGLFTYSPPAAAKPKVSWAPAAVAVEVGAGQSTTTTATFTATANASNVAVWVVPALAPYVTVTPTSFASVQKGMSYPVNLTIAASTTAPLGTTTGTIHLRQGSATIAKPLPVSVEVVWPTFDGGQDLGFSIQYPPGWVVTEKPNSLLFRNVAVSSRRIEDQLYHDSFFKVSVGRDVNHALLPITDWFAGFSERAGDIISTQPTQVDGHDAVLASISEFGGTRAHVYIALHTNVIEVTYPVFQPLFISDYDAMLQSITFAE